MKIITYSLMEWNNETNQYDILEETSYEYDGPMALCGGGGKTTTNTMAEPWDEAKPYFERMYKRAEDLSTSGTPQYYPGQTVASQSPFTIAGQQSLLNFMYGNQNAPQVGATTQTGYGIDGQNVVAGPGGSVQAPSGTSTGTQSGQTDQSTTSTLPEGMSVNIAYGWQDLADAQQDYRVAQQSAKYEADPAYANKILRDAQAKVASAANSLKSQGWVEPWMSTEDMLGVAGQRSSSDWWNQNYTILPAYGG